MARQPLPLTARSQELSDDVGFALPLSVHSLGAAHVVLGTDGVVPSTGTLFALLLRVAYSPEFRVRRDELLRMLWPAMTPERQRANLRQTLYKARSMGIDASLSGDSVRLNGAQVVRTFSLEQTTALFDRDVVRGSEPFGVFLPSYVVPWPEFQRWVDAQRETVHAGVRRVLVEQLRERRKRADWTGAEQFARWLLQFDSLNEEATFTVAECTLLAGSKTEAVAILDRYLDEIGPDAGDIRLPATLLRKRFTEPQARQRPSLQATERHFVGRTAELASLTMAMRRARWSEGGATLIHGPSGIGKTRLSAELTKAAIIEGFRIIDLGCREAEQARNLGTLIDLIPELLQEPGAIGCSPESLEILHHIRRVEPNDSLDEPTRLGMRQPLPNTGAIRASFIDLVLAISYERPSLLIIDDAQWLDDATWDALVELMDRLENARLFCLLLARDSSPRRRGAGYLPPQLTRVQLPALGHEDATRLAHSIANDFAFSLTDSLADWFAMACEGGPLYLKALLTHWVETGEAGGVPPTLLAVLDQRLNRLSNDALRVIQTITLLDKLALPHLIREILELETFRLLDALEELSRSGALRETESSLEVHHLLSKSALMKLSSNSVRTLRRRIGEVLGSKLERLAAPLELVAAENLALGGDIDGLAQLNIDAFITFLRSGEAHRAIDLFDASAPYLRDHHHRSELELRLQDALYLGGHYSRLLNTPRYLQHISSADLIWDTSHPEEVLRMLEAAEHSTNADDYADLAARALLITESDAVQSTVRLRAAIFTIRSAANSSVSGHAKRAYETAICLLENLVVEPHQRDQVEMYYHAVFDDMDRANAAAIRLAMFADHLTDQNSRIKILADAAWALRMTGALAEAASRFESIARDARKLKMFPSSAISATFRSTLAFEIDEDHQQAAYWLDFAGELATESGDLFTSFVYHTHRARLAILMDDGATAKLSLEAISKATGGHAIANSYVKALKLGYARIASDLPTIQILTPQVLESARNGTRLFGQDFRTAQLFQAMTLLGDNAGADHMLRSYITEQRRERTPLPHYLRQYVHH